MTTRKGGVVGWWERLHWTMKAAGVLLAATGTVFTVGATVGDTGHDLMAIPVRVDSLEAHDRRQEQTDRGRQRAIDANFDTVRAEVREVKEILLDMNCEQRGLSAATCREERLRGR